MTIEFSSLGQSPLLAHNRRESQWSQVSNGLWVPKISRPVPDESAPEHQSLSHTTTEETPSSQIVPDDSSGWKRYWVERGWPWRREPEISLARQQELAQRRTIPVDMEQGSYPFRGMTLTRADIEWLLVTHDEGLGPVDWNEESHRKRKGLDLRGAHVSEGTDLSSLPLARLQGGLWFDEMASLGSEELCAHALLWFQHINLREAHLEGAILFDAHLEGTDLREAHLEEAILPSAHLEKTILWRAHLEGAILLGIYLEEANLREAHLEGVCLMGAHLERASLLGAHLEMADLRAASLSPVTLTQATLANAAGIGPTLVDAQWGETNLSVANWSQVRMLGDEDSASQSLADNGQKKTSAKRQEGYQYAYRANHQLAVVLQNQGLTDNAAHFAYRAKCLKRTVLRYDFLLARTMKQRFQIGWSLLFSWTLFLLAGYGYRIWRCLLWYGGVVLLFMFFYWWLDPIHVPWWTALGESVNVFHGRGATPSIAELVHPIRFTLLTVAEAIIGLVVEVVFVATMIQRLFGK